jgi:HK97 gp10 family phage protein
VSVRLLGLAKTKAALKKVQLQVEAAAGPAAEAGGQVVQREMASRAPRDTGRLVSLIGVEEDSFGSGATAKVGSDAPYDRFVQRGTRNMAAQPYGQESAVAAAPGVVASMAAIFKAAAEA